MKKKEIFVLRKNQHYTCRNILQKYIQSIFTQIIEIKVNRLMNLNFSRKGCQLLYSWYKFLKSLFLIEFVMPNIQISSYRNQPDLTLDSLEVLPSLKNNSSRLSSITVKKDVMDIIKNGNKFENRIRRDSVSDFLLSDVPPRTTSRQ